MFKQHMCNTHTFHIKVSSLKTRCVIFEVTNLCQNTHIIHKILHYACFNWTCSTCSYVKWVWDMPQYNNKLSDFQCERFHILAMYHFGLFSSAGVLLCVTMNDNSLIFNNCLEDIYGVWRIYMVFGGYIRCLEDYMVFGEYIRCLKYIYIYMVSGGNIWTHTLSL